MTNVVINPGNVLQTTAKTNVIIYGHRDNTTYTKQILIARGVQDTDNAIKIGGTSEKELEIELSPSNFESFVELLSHKPLSCTFDISTTPPTFQIVVEF